MPPTLMVEGGWRLVGGWLAAGLGSILARSECRNGRVQEFCGKIETILTEIREGIDPKSAQPRTPPFKLPSRLTHHASGVCGF